MKIKGKSKDPKRAEADQKRILSMVEMKKGYHQQKSLIKQALSKVDFQPKNKIVFGDSENEQEESDNQQENSHTTNGYTKKSLFDDEDDENVEEDCNFNVKEHFEGDKGQKLMQLQSKFKNDKRFVMDERFLEDEANQNGNIQSEHEEMTQEEEKEKQFEILNEVLGKRINSSVVNNGFKESQKKKVMMRFDPTQPEHSKFEVKEQVPEKKKQKRKNVEENEKRIEEVEKPIVSKEMFYKVTDDLKISLEKEQQEFSLLSMFNRTQDEEDADNNEETGSQNETALVKKKKLVPDSNPFKYDSSSDEEPDKEDKSLKEPSIETKTSTKQPDEQSKTPRMFFSERFFFKNDDYRLQEGLDFVKRLAGEEADFTQVRRNLKEIVRAKVRQNQRKNKPFKRKLGGRKKMIKIRKAMKR